MGGHSDKSHRKSAWARGRSAGGDDTNESGLSAEKRSAVQRKASLEEYFDTFTEPDNTSWLVVTSIVTDPQYLTDPYAYAVHFKKIPDGQGWDPTSCVADDVR